VGSYQLEARVQETFTLLVSAVESEGFRKDEPLETLVRTIVLKQIAAYTDEDVLSQDEPGIKSPGVSLNQCHRGTKSIHLKDQDALVKVLRSTSVRDQEALFRFYSYKQPPEKICEEMHFSETQFLLLKGAVKESFCQATTATSEGGTWKNRMPFDRDQTNCNSKEKP